ncbi:hypothetical protein PTKIN_Ptkin17bG0103900 [Pterospermum kingtungense]
MSITTGDSKKIESGDLSSSIENSKSVEVCSKGASLWENTLMAQFIGRRPNFSYFQKGFGGGPWHIQNQPIVLRKWEKGMEHLHFDMTKIPLWLHLGNVPLELFNQEGLCYVASALGEPLYMDRVTASRERFAYAKVCVEVEATDTIPISIEILMPEGNIVIVTVEIPWMPSKCQHCKIFGHSDKFCTKHAKKTKQVWRQVFKPTAQQDTVTVEIEKFAVNSGDTTLKIGQHKEKGVVFTPVEKGYSQNRFAILTEADNKQSVEKEVPVASERTEVLIDISNKSVVQSMNEAVSQDKRKVNLGAEFEESSGVKSKSY